MKTDSQAFPYPILSHDQVISPDFYDSAFQCHLLIELTEDALTLHVEYNFMLSNDEIKSLIHNSEASFAIEMVSTNSYYREIHKLNEKGYIDLPATNFYGSVEFTPMIVIIASNVKFTSDDLNPEFGGRIFDLKAGDIIALDNPTTKFFYFEKLRFESQISYKPSADLGEFQYAFELEGDQITILVGLKLSDLVCKFREDTELIPHLASSIYKDCVFFALLSLAENNNNPDKTLWMSSLEIKLIEIGRSLPDKNKLEDLDSLAQDIVGQPGFRKLHRIHIPPIIV